MESALSSDQETSGLAVFTLLLPREETENGRIGAVRPVQRRINISYMANMRPKKGADTTPDIVPYRDSDLVRDGLVSNVAMAIERISDAESAVSTETHKEGKMA